MAQTDGGNNKFKDAHVFLLQRAVIIARSVKDGYETRAVVELTKDMSVADVSMWDISGVGENTCAWSLKGGSHPDITFAAKSLIDKQEWMKEMSGAIVLSAQGQITQGRLPAPPPLPQPPEKREDVDPMEGIHKEEWYHGVLRTETAEARLLSRPDGEFLVYKEEKVHKDRVILAVVVGPRKVCHLPLSFDLDGSSLRLWSPYETYPGELCETEFSTVVECISKGLADNCIYHDIDGAPQGIELKKGVPAPAR